MTGPLGLLILLSLMIGGCASVRGSQEWLTKADLERHAAICPSREDLLDKPDGEAAGAHRDRIIWECTRVINVKYNEFTQALSREAGIANLGTDLLSQGFATAASVVDGAELTKKLAAASALSLGVGATINKDLFYKQTLPAIVASMDAKRSKVLTDIARAQNEDPDASSYTLARAGHDLDRLQQAGSLSAAVSELTSAALKNARDADEERQRAEVMNLGLAREYAPGVRERTTKVIADIDALVAGGKTPALQSIATELKLGTPANANLDRLSRDIRGAALAARSLEGQAAQEEAIKKVEDAVNKYKGGSK